MHELDVIGVRVEMPGNQPLVLLREHNGERFLPIWIGAVEAAAIAFALESKPAPRPPTHQLMSQIIEVLGDSLTVVQIDHVDDGIFYATLVFASGTKLSARPSDSIALALRSGAPIEAADSVLDEAGVHMPAEDQAVVAKFREFLSDVKPEDFA